jgi:hypothetical protein
MINNENRKLVNAFIGAKYLNVNYEGCINWAIKQIEKGVDEDNINILAGLNPNNSWEIEEYIEKIIGEENVFEDNNIQTWAGEVVVKNGEKYFGKEIDIFELERILTELCYKLNYPDWLVMLSRNCEYATDIKSFEKPFLDELNYIMDLWKKSFDLNDFNKKYDRSISNNHDVK